MARTRVAWLSAYAVACFLSFPHPLGGWVLDLGLGVAWLGPACLLLGLRGLSPRRAAGLGFAAGLVAHAAVFHWIYVVTVVYGHAPGWIGVAAPVALAIYPAAFTAAFGAGLAWLGRRALGGPTAVATLWTALDHLRSFALTGFPWATLGYAQHGNSALLALAPLTGVYGLSFVTAWGGASLAQCVLAWREQRRVGREPLVAIAAIALLHTAGGASLVLAEPANGPPVVRVAVLQGNVDQGVKWSPEWAARTLRLYEELSRRAAREGAEAIVWPETAVPGSISTSPDLAERLSGLARETGALLVAGGVGVERVSSGWRFYDSAFAFAPSGELLHRYDKSHLVPFGEYVPLRGLLGSSLRALARGIAPEDVSAGAGPRPLVLPRPNQSGFVTVGVPICYELVFPDLVRRFVRDGAEVFFALTNDAWYGRTGAPYQFLAMTAVRSAENRVWTARAANTGVSAIIDNRGRVRAQTRLFERDLLVADVPLEPRPGGSFYARHGDVFALGSWAALAALGLAGWVRGRRAGGP